MGYDVKGYSDPPFGGPSGPALMELAGGTGTRLCAQDFSLVIRWLSVSAGAARVHRGLNERHVGELLTHAHGLYGGNVQKRWRPDLDPPGCIAAI